jgi:hypothetical protein
MTEPLMRVRDEAIIPVTDALVSTGRLPSDLSQYIEPIGLAADLALVRQLCTKAATMLPVDEMDSWLAPRLHNTLRISRRLASDGGLWVWLSLQVRDFVEARFHAVEGRVHPWRYRQTWSRNALARLWWGAEMTRNGPSYVEVPLCFARTRTAQFALELMYSWSRPAAIAFVRVAEEGTSGRRITDDLMKGLSTRLRVYLTLRSLDSVSSADDAAEEFDVEWASHTPSLTSLLAPGTKQLVGPSTGTCSEAAISELAAWFREILTELRIAGTTGETSRTRGVTVA